MTLRTTPSVRRTLPAPSEPLDIDALRVERDLLLDDNLTLLKRLDAQAGIVREANALMAELLLLREEVATLRDRLRQHTPVLARPQTVIRIAPPSPAEAMPPHRDGVHAPGEIPGGAFRASEPHASSGIDFGTVSRLSPGELDKLPYGLICLDSQGRVVCYNDTESRLAKLPKDRVIGRNFFTEVAPCTRVREFEGEFHDLVRDPSRIRVRSFDFIFRFKHSEQHVTIVITPARTRGLYNMALLRRSVVVPT